MAVNVTDFVGYRGMVKFRDKIILATNGSASFQAAPIAAEGTVWGAGSWNAADRIAWEGDFPEVQANFSCFPNTDGSEDYSLKKIEEASSRFAISQEESGYPIEIHPANRWGFSGYGYVDQLSLHGDEKQNLTAEVQLKAYFKDTQSVLDFNKEGTSAQTGDVGLQAGNVPEQFGYNGLFPYWGQYVYMAGDVNDDMPNVVNPTASQTSKTSVQKTERKRLSEITGWKLVDNITSWSANFQHNIVFKKTCGMQKDAPKASDGWPLQPDYVALGVMNGNCDISYIGTIAEYNYQNFYHVRSLKVAYTSPLMNETDPLTFKHQLGIPAMVCENYPMEVSAGGDFIVASFSYTPVGNGFEPPVLLKTWGGAWS